MQKAIILILTIILSITTYGCTTQNNTPSPNNITDEITTHTETIQLFYGSAGNEKLITEESKITFSNPSDKYQLALETLFNGPTDTNLMRNIPEGTKVYETIVQDQDITVNLNSNFSGFPGSMAEILAVGSIVNTLTQFKEIERVKILVEGEELIGPNGNPRGFMIEFPLEP